MASGATSTSVGKEHVDAIRKAHDAVMGEVRKIIIGQDAVVEDVLSCFFSGGHCLITGVPGLAKTLLISSLGRALKLNFKRIQFTPDLMPSDIVGHEILDEEEGKRKLTFVPGPIFSNIVLADEINRTPPKTQAALLEAMQEHQVTSGGISRKLDEPFFVLATQNPIEQEGTYPLPIAQQDRFMFSLFIGYPTKEEEMEILDSTTTNKQVDIQPALDGPSLLKSQQVVRAIPVASAIATYAVSLVNASRPDHDKAPDFVKQYVSVGASLRGSQYLVLGAKARAAMDGRLAVSLDDIRAVAYSVLRHRIVVNFKADAAKVNSDEIVKRLIEKVPAPQATM
ncbi:MAG: MoxR family ATPase [Planctomycetes bacterium]|nr:MoxR family ATPase [Planctomycetota bacterium]